MLTLNYPALFEEYFMNCEKDIDCEDMLVSDDKIYNDYVAMINCDNSLS